MGPRVNIKPKLMTITAPSDRTDNEVTIVVDGFRVNY